MPNLKVDCDARIQSDDGGSERELEIGFGVENRAASGQVRHHVGQTGAQRSGSPEQATQRAGLMWLAAVMPMGDCEKAFAAAAAADGILLNRARVPWLNQRGHLGLPEEADGVRGVLASIFSALDGDPVAQAGKRLTPLPGDFVHEPSQTFIEIDESQHFTTHRLVTLGLYPADLAVGFDMEQYRALCASWSPKSDRYRARKAAVGFGDGGRGRQRAYHDALRDLATPAMGLPPVIRVPAPNRDGTEAFERVRERMLALLG